ncbi:glycosyltransferase involved in cell wall biosynthesis [Actinoplanes lutulentus]|uniref:Glycosyl transferase family 2 n=1 Tax=Actinoplanes lutulentus TaxID=1287878 RepID=A0A327YXW6_9ACTN|nr:glycosyltransferase family 2 protein [Actinoplanes lutulentus]MBB2943422.1 glycosyltransferase involved in cell wall biosynthesis [Actinoplanes lutulentus]RAK26059.1 glycosyl transferase family 2 [Actinoplanes lutulentus]
MVQGAPQVTVLLPARNEAANLGWVLQRMPSFVDEVVLIDGDSHDETADLAVRHRPDIRVVHQGDGLGKGSGVRAGLRAGAGDILVVMDADGSMSPDEIRALIGPLHRGYDLVKGSRFRPGGGSHDITPWRRLGNRLLLTVLNALYATRHTDLCYGFWAVRREALDRLPLTADGFEIEAEVIVRAVRAGLRIAEVPSVELARRSGRSHLRSIPDGWRVLRVLLRVPV